MRRRHLLAAVLTVAATVCIASFWWEMWLVVAYEKKVDAQGVAYLERRFGWIPGSYWVARNQTCKQCRQDNCNSCAQGWTLTGTSKIHGQWNLRNFNPDDWSIEGAPGQPDEHSRGSLAVAYCTCPTCYPERAK